MNITNNKVAWEINQDGNIYELTSEIESDRVKLFCRRIYPPASFDYLGSFSLVELMESNPIIFKNCSDIYEAQNLINKDIKNNKIRIINYQNHFDLEILMTNKRSSFPQTFNPNYITFQNYPYSKINTIYPKIKKSEFVTLRLPRIISKQRLRSNAPITINNYIHEPYYQHIERNQYPNNYIRPVIEEIKEEERRESINTLNAPINQIIMSHSNPRNEHLLNQIPDIMKRLNELERKNNNEIFINKNKDNRIRELELINQNLKSQLNDMNQLLNQAKERIIIMNNTKLVSVEAKGEIIKTKEELGFLLNKINPYAKIKIDLIYKATVDSDKASIFHQKCDFASRTLVLVETVDNRRFGGYTTKSWSGENIQKDDENAFIFSLDNKRIYDIIPGKPAIACYPSYGPIFLDCQIQINNNSLTQGGSTYLKEQNYKTTEDFELNGGNKDFQIKEIEVYNVEI